MTQNDIVLSIIDKGKMISLGSIGTEALLLSLMEMEDSMTSLILNELKINEKNIIDVISSIYILRKDNNEFTNDLKYIIEEANELEKNNNYVYDEAYLYSLINHDNLATAILKKLKIENYVILDELNNALMILNEDDKLLENITLQAMNNKLDPFIGREDILISIDNILSKKKKNNCMLLGDAGVGKSGIVEGLASYYIKNNNEKNIYRLDIASLLSGTRYRGDLEERLENCLEDVKDENSILFIDEIHTITSSNSTDNNLDIGNILKPYLARNKIRCIGATTLYEYNKYIYHDKALVRRFQNIYIKEPDDLETYKILKGIYKNYEEFYNIKYSNNVLKKIVDASSLVINNNNPDKSIDILDEIGIITKRKGKDRVSVSDIIDFIMKKNNINRKDSCKKIREMNNYLFLNDYLNIKNNKYIACLVVNDLNEIYTITNDVKSILNFEKENILEIDFLDYDFQSLYSVLLGASHGYIAYDEGGILTNHILKNDKSIIIFKNYNKSNLKEKHLIEKIKENAFIVDNKNNKVRFSNCFILIHPIKENTVITFK